MGIPSIIAIGGPTASGKTELAIALAQKHQTEIISFDSRQLYKELSIGVARPSETELARCIHHGIAEHSIFNPLSAGEFARLYRPKVEYLLKTNGCAILVGGTGLYLQHLLYDLDEIPTAEETHSQQVNQRYLEVGLSGLVNDLLSLDPQAGSSIDLQNPARVKRALELCIALNKPLAEIYTGSKTPHFPLINLQVLGIEWDRTSLYQRINQRVDSMMKAGLLQEVQSLLPFAHLPVLKTVGYTELMDYLSNTITLEQAVEQIKQHSRNYAKRQITYFNRQFETKWLKKDSIM